MGNPGGVVERYESLKQCCQREIRVEIGLDRKIGGLLDVDYISRTDEKTESLMFIFDGGMLTSAEILSIQLNQGELSEFRYFSIENLPVEMTATLR